jgi:hypothetical protein
MAPLFSRTSLVPRRFIGNYDFGLLPIGQFPPIRLFPNSGNAPDLPGFGRPFRALTFVGMWGFPWALPKAAIRAAPLGRVPKPGAVNAGEIVAPNRKVSLGIEQHLDDFCRKHRADS